MASISYQHVPITEDGVGESNNARSIELAGISISPVADAETPHPSTGSSCADEKTAAASAVSTHRHTLHRLHFLSAGISLLMVSLVLVPWIFFLYHFVGRLWSVWIIVLFVQFHLWTATRTFEIAATGPDDHRGVDDAETSLRVDNRSRLARWSCVGKILDFVLCIIVAPLALHLLTENIFRDVDGTINFDWQFQVYILRFIVFLGFIVAILTMGVAAAFFANKEFCLPSDRNADYIISQTTRQLLNKMFPVLNTATLILNMLCAISIWAHFGPYPEVSLIPNGHCNPMDSTMCALPFPSYYHMRQDNTTTTGWKVNLRGLPPLRGGIPLRPKFLNELDGFSTMAPILFYVDGLKEAHEHEEGMANHSHPRLQGLEHIVHSMTNQSITLLINVDDHALVPHSAEIDYLDPDLPLVMVIPAQPLRHETNYAVAVVNAHDANGNRLPQTQAVKDMLTAPSRHGDPQHEKLASIVAALSQSVPWVDFDDDPESVQLLFGFVTISQECQIGHTRAVRDATLEHVKKWNWEEHVELVSKRKHDCDMEDNALIAYTYHINLDVPSFLESRSRYSTLDATSLNTGEPVSIDKAKVMIRIPCSVERAALGDEDGRPVKAIMEYGHGLFNHRGEVRDAFLSRMANDNGYVLMAMDWRGMSRFDLPIVIKTLIGNPNLFQAVRDNLIQGYSEKLALLHFARNGGMLNWLKLGGFEIPTEENKPPTSIFYGISQGGILGGGYLALAGKTNLIDRGVLGSPGTTFASVMTRSRDFVGYDMLMLFNFYNNRHVRLLLTLVQMGWDSVETSGLLAPFVDESLPPVLIQTGLGDAVVPTGACEAMVRAMHGSTLPNNPRSIYGVPVQEPEQDLKVVLTELLYEREYDGLPEDNTLPNGNSVHWCVRNDPAMINQIEQFANTGRIIDPCVEDQCKRKSSRC